MKPLSTPTGLPAGKLYKKNLTEKYSNMLETFVLEKLNAIWMR
jgi:hypothetical protein